MGQVDGLRMQKAIADGGVCTRAGLAEAGSAAEAADLVAADSAGRFKGA